MIVLPFLGVTATLFQLSCLRPFAAPRTARRFSHGHCRQPHQSQLLPLPSLPEDTTYCQPHAGQAFTHCGLYLTAAGPPPAPHRCPPSRPGTGTPTVPLSKRQPVPHPRRRRRPPRRHRPPPLRPQLPLCPGGGHPPLSCRIHPSLQRMPPPTWPPAAAPTAPNSDLLASSRPTPPTAAPSQKPPPHCRCRCHRRRHRLHQTPAASAPARRQASNRIRAHPRGP